MNHRTFLLVVWTLFILWSMDVSRPSESPWVHNLSKWFGHHGMPEYTPAKLYHCGSFFLWVILLAGALAGAYWMPLSPKVLRGTILALIVFASTTEALQSLNSVRTPSLIDVGINVAGGSLGLLFQAFAARRRSVA